MEYDGGDPVEVLHWASESDSPNFKPDNATDETVTVALGNPEGALRMSRAALSCGAPDATERLVALVEDLAEERAT